MPVKGIVDAAVTIANSTDPVDASKEFTVKISEVPPPSFPWWILGLIAAGFVLAVVASGKAR